MKTAAWKLAFCSLAIALCTLCACSRTQEKAAEPSQSLAQTEMSSPTPDPTPEPEPTTEPTPMLGIEAGDYKDTFTCEENGQWLDYYVFVPNDAPEGLPLIVYLHGDGMTSRIDWLPDYDIAKMAKENYGYDFPFILLTPNNRYPEWYDGV